MAKPDIADKAYKSWIFNAKRQKNEYNESLEMLNHLANDNPKWDCGTPFLKHEIMIYKNLHQSRVNRIKEMFSDCLEVTVQEFINTGVASL